MSDTDRIEGKQGPERMSLSEIKEQMLARAAARFRADNTGVQAAPFPGGESGRLFTSIEDNAKRNRVTFEAFMPGIFKGIETFNNLGEKVINEVSITFNSDGIMWSGKDLDEYKVWQDGNEPISLGQFDSNEGDLAKINEVWKKIKEALDTIETNNPNADTQAAKDEPSSTRDKVS